MPHAVLIAGSWVPAIASSSPPFAPTAGEWEVSCFRVLNAVLVVFYATCLCLCACVCTSMCFCALCSATFSECL